jgi:hypothetical protein
MIASITQIQYHCISYLGDSVHLWEVNISDFLGQPKQTQLMIQDTTEQFITEAIFLLQAF